MSAADVLLGLTIVTVWGANFTVIKIGLTGVPPMLLAALRYVLVAFPAIFFVPRPKAPVKYWIAYGLTVGAGQFGSLFLAMSLGMPAGLASVVLQSQSVFTLIFAAWLLKERISKARILGIVISGIGLALITWSLGDAASAPVPALALLLTLLAAGFWGLSNVVIRRAVQAVASMGERLDMLSMVVWSALVPPLPLLALAVVLHTPTEMARAFVAMSGASIFSVAYLAFAATFLGYGGWNQLLARYPASTVAPLSLLVPVVGLVVAMVVLGERLSATEWLGAALVVGGLRMGQGRSANAGLLSRNLPR